MKRKQHITAFYLETLLMIVVFISIILVLTRVFGSARVQSVEAENLTSAVTIAQNTAEAVSASHSPQELQGILDEGGNTLLLENMENRPADQAVENASLITALYDARMNPIQLSQEMTDAVETSCREGKVPILQDKRTLLAETVWKPAVEVDRAGLVDVEITVFNALNGKLLYSLNTSVYVPETE